MSTGRGLRDGFEAYGVPSDSEYQQVLTTAMVVLDTNVLLNLYRYAPDSRTSIFRVLDALAENLFIPHQVAAEFWRNRERALVNPATEVKTSLSGLTLHREGLIEVINAAVNRGALSSAEAAVLSQAIEEGLKPVLESFGKLVDQAAIKKWRNPSNDEVALRLVELLDGRVGAPMSDQEQLEAVKEGKRRSQAGEPPGFADEKKNDKGGEGAAGDYLVWEQMLREASDRQADALFVTSDVKADWWRHEGGSPRGPHVALYEEFRQRTGRQLFMLTPDRLLQFAEAALSVEVDEESVRDIERVGGQQSSTQVAAETGWTKSAASSLLSRLRRSAPVQAAAIEQAVQQGGYVSREEVYDLGDYEPGRQLKGFTRPVNRLAQQLRDEGQISSDAADPLLPVYDQMSHGFGWVDGFRVPDELIEVFSD